MNSRALADLIVLGEGFTTEFKRAGTSGIGRELCAFANATGGTILIGVSDAGDVIGVADHNRLKSEVQATARSADPPIAVEVESVGEVLSIRVPEQQSKPYSFGGKFFIREGASSLQMPRDEIREFFFAEGLIHFDETPCPDYDLAVDLTPEVWSRFAARAKLPSSVEMQTALRNLHLIKDGKMTHAGAWLLCDDITRFTLRAGVTCALFRGTTNVHILDRRDFTGDLYSIYEDCMGYLQARLNTAMIPHAHGRDERLELPSEALREALVNAIAHRDYRSTANVEMRFETTGRKQVIRWVLSWMPDVKVLAPKSLRDRVCEKLEAGLRLQILEESGYAIHELNAVGGGARSRAWTQLKADVTGRPVNVMEVTEAGCLGVAMLARAALEESSVDALAYSWVRPVETVEPAPGVRDHYTARFDDYRKLYACARALAEA